VLAQPLYDVDPQNNVTKTAGSNSGGFGVNNIFATVFAVVAVVRTQSAT